MSILLVFVPATLLALLEEIPAKRDLTKYKTRRKTRCHTFA